MLLHTKNICKNVHLLGMVFTSIFISTEIGLDFQLFLHFPEFDLDLHQSTLILQMLVEKMMDGFLLILILEHLL